MSHSLNAIIMMKNNIKNVKKTKKKNQNTINALNATPPL